MIDILTTNQTVAGEMDTIELAGTNNQWAVGILTWTNTANAESGSYAVSGLEFQISSIPLAFGINTITVSATNAAGGAASDSVTLTRSSESGADNPIHYVSLDGSHTWPYASWQTAATNIQAAVNTAAAGDTVRVASGTYREGSEIFIDKAITLESLHRTDKTIIDGQNGHRCVYLSVGASLDGFIIQNGTMIEGGGVYCDGGTVKNCVLSGNTAFINGGGIFCGPGSTAQNCTIYGNFAQMSGGGILCSGGTVQNSIIWNNTTSFEIDANYANYGGNFFNTCTWPQIGLFGITADPLFTDAANGDYTLLPYSPCINAGNSSYVTTEADLAGNVRIFGAAVDIGAYEYVTGTDTDADGIPDTWEQRYFSSVVDCVTNAYTDDDAFNNWQEYIAGTDPTDATSYFCVTNCCSEADGFLVEWESVSGRVYSVSYASSLTNEFQTLESDIAYPKSSYTDTHVMTQGFYRVEVELED
jgi:hypothetical protein